MTSMPTSAAPAPIRYDFGPRPTPLWRRIAPWLIAFAVACAWDRALWLMVTRGGVPILQRLEDSIAWGTLGPNLRAAAHLDAHAIGQVLLALAYGAVYYTGRLWPWIALALFFIFRHWGGTDGAKVREGLRRGLCVFIVPVLAGAGAEALKFLTRRERPEDADGHYAFVPWPHFEPLSGKFWSTSHLGLASSHAAVAFGGALAAGLLLPRWRVPLWTLAILCAASRVAVGAHFLSDAVAGLAIAFGAYAIVYAMDTRLNGGRPLVRT